MKLSKRFCLVLALMFLAFGCKKKPAAMPERPLYRAVKAGNIEDVRSLIAEGADMDGHDGGYNSPLHVSIQEGHKQIAEVLMDSGADINARRGRGGRTPLHWAVIEGYKDICELLIAKGADIDAGDDLGDTPLHHVFVSDSNGLAIAELLISKGADVNAMSKYSGTPLHEAISFERGDIAEFLMDSGADVDATQSDGQTPLHVAVRWFRLDPNMAELLIERGADVTARDRNGTTPLHLAVFDSSGRVPELLIGSGAEVNAKDKNGTTPLHLAAFYGHSEVIELLVAQGAEVNAGKINGDTPLHEAAASGCEGAVRLLVANGADVSAKTVSGETPLILAAKGGHEEVVGFLVANGADVDSANRSGYPALHLAASGGRTEVAELLIANGANINAVTPDGKTPLISAIVRGHWETVHLLVAKGADVNAKTTLGRAPLHEAARKGRANMAELLVASGANVKVKDADGITPLHEAARRGYYDLVDLLVEKGAEVGARTKAGRKALELARAAGHKEIVQCLSVERGGLGEERDKGERDLAVGEESEAVAELLTDMNPLVLGNSTFACDLYRRLCNSEGNLFFSPYSISAALAMAYAGASGDTRTQMAKTLYFSSHPNSIHAEFAKLQAGLNELQKNTSAKLCIANSLWPHEDYKFLDEYLSLLAKSFDVSVTAVDYVKAREAASKAINEWVEKKTEGKIRNLVQPGFFNDLTRLVLVNAIYFKCDWMEPFEAGRTREAPFYVSLKRSVRVSMMTQEQTVRYAEHRSYTILELPYRADRLSMMIILPRRIEGLKHLEASLSIESIARWRHSLEERKVLIYLARFKMTSQFMLAEPLAGMGMGEAFDPERANFAGMDGRDDFLFISGVIHKAFVEVNEEGIEATAATAVGMMGGMPAAPPTFRADHPFLFLIQDNHTGSILFIGRMVDPTTSD